MTKRHRWQTWLPLTLLFGLASSGLAAEETGHEHHQHEATAQAAGGEAGHEHHHEAAAEGGEDPHAHHKAMMSKPAEPPKSTDVRIEDRELVDQEGRKVKFASDVIGERIVVMDFVYTTCTTVCPVLTALFKQLQDRLGERLGKEVFLVSVTVDPTRDTPQRLKAYAAKHGAGEGWTWLTGASTNVNAVLDGLDAYTPNFEDHPSMVLVGDARSGEWTRFFGFPSPDRILARVDELTQARHASADASMVKE
jgi:protein SCO1/2